MPAETRTTRWTPETDPQWRPCLLDGHRDRTTGTRWVLCTICLCCSLDLNCWLFSGQRRMTLFRHTISPSKYCKADVKPPSFISSWCKYTNNSDLTWIIKHVLFIFFNYFNVYILKKIWSCLNRATFFLICVSSFPNIAYSLKIY